MLRLMNTTVLKVFSNSRWKILEKWKKLTSAFSFWATLHCCGWVFNAAVLLGKHTLVKWEWQARNY